MVNSVNDFPQLVRCDSSLQNNWIKVRTIGTKSNRSGIGTRLRCVVQMPGEPKPHQQIDEVRSGGGYFSQNDLRVHFGIGKAQKIDILELRWPSGLVETLKDIQPNQLIYVKEGEGIVRNVSFSALKKESRERRSNSISIRVCPAQVYPDLRSSVRILSTVGFSKTSFRPLGHRISIQSILLIGSQAEMHSAVAVGYVAGAAAHLIHQNPAASLHANLCAQTIAIGFHALSSGR